MSKELLKNIKHDLLRGVSHQEAVQKTAILTTLCKDAETSNPKLAIEAAKFVLWFGTDKDTVAEVLMNIARHTWKDDPAIAMKASITMVDLGVNPQERIDDNAVILKDIATRFANSRPQLAQAAAERVLRDCDNQDTVEASLKILEMIRPKTTLSEIGKSSAIPDKTSLRRSV